MPSKEGIASLADILKQLCGEGLKTLEVEKLFADLGKQRIVSSRFQVPLAETNLLACRWKQEQEERKGEREREGGRLGDFYEELPNAYSAKKHYRKTPLISTYVFSGLAMVQVLIFGAVLTSGGGGGDLD